MKKFKLYNITYILSYVVSASTSLYSTRRYEAEPRRSVVAKKAVVKGEKISLRRTLNEDLPWKRQDRRVEEADCSGEAL